MKRFSLAALGGATVILLGLLWAKPLRRAAVAPRVTLAPAQLVADGYDTAVLTVVLTVGEPSAAPPRVTIVTAGGAVSIVALE